MTNEQRGPLGYDEYDGDVRDVVTIEVLDDDGIYDRLWQPYLARASEEHLIVAFGRHLAGKIDMGDLVCSISTDGGSSWSRPNLIFDHREMHGGRRYAYANPVLYRADGDDLIWCFGMRCSLHYRDSEDAELCAAYSADGGYSWQPVELTNRHHAPVIVVAGITRVAESDGADRYLLPIHCNTLRHDPRGRYDHFVLESTNLISWNLASYIPQAPAGSDPDGVFLHEGNIAIAPDGSLEIVMRTGKGSGKPGALDVPVAYRSISRDGGRSWSVPEPQPALHNTVSKAFYGYSAAGTAVYVYSVGPWRERKGLGYVLRPDGGDWSDPRVFFDADARNSYPTLIERVEHPGEFLCVWDSSTTAERKRNAIRFGTLTVSSE